MGRKIHIFVTGTSQPQLKFKIVAGLFTHLFNLFYPNLCLICGDSLVSGEELLCLNCFNKIPKTHYHTVNNNPVEQRFWGKVQIERASAYFFFYKGSDLQTIMHHLKYKGNKRLGVILGRYAATDLCRSADFRAIDLILPVPLHPKKQAKRGYNQSEQIVTGIAEIMHKPVMCDNLYRKIASDTQTKKSVYDRFKNTQGIFALKAPEALAGKHILLVDDVLTTGSTLEACIQTLLTVENVKVSVFTLALATQ